MLLSRALGARGSVGLSSRAIGRMITGGDGGEGGKPDLGGWRKQQLEKLEKKFSESGQAEEVELQPFIQPMWRDMESRVTRRRPRTVEEAGGKVGRRNVRKTDEDVWADAGVYDGDNSNKHQG